MVAVFAIADGRDGDDEAQPWEGLKQDSYGKIEVVGTFKDGQLLLLKKALRAFLTVVYYLSCIFEDVNMVCAEREDGGALLRLLKRHGFVFQESVHRMENTCRIVHHTVGVDDGVKLLVDEAPADVISKARPDKEHALHGLNLPFALRNIYDGSKLH